MMPIFIGKESKMLKLSHVTLMSLLNQYVIYTSNHQLLIYDRSVEC